MRERPRADDRERRFEQSFQDSWVATFRFALAWTNDWAAAEDLAQEAFSRLWASRDKVDWTKPMLPWLLQVTRRLATDRFQRLRRISPFADRAPRVSTQTRAFAGSMSKPLLESSLRRNAPRSYL